MNRGVLPHSLAPFVPIPARPGIGYRALLLEELGRRKARNARYSVRAFAKALGVSKTALADALAFRRNLSPRSATRIATKLEFSPERTREMLDEIRTGSGEQDDRRFLPIDGDLFSLISDWPHYAILCLALFPEACADVEWIARRLEITPTVAGEALQRLLRLGLLEVHAGKLHRSTQGLTTTSDIPSAALRKYHRQNLQLADASLDRDAVDRREMTSAVIPIAAKSLPEAKRLIRQFRRRMSRLLESPTPDTIYTLAIQFFPVTRGERS